MRKTIIMALAAVVMAACTAKPVQEGWVKVEGNKFISHGKTSEKLTSAMLQTSIL